MTQPLFDFATYFKFFIGLFALVNPVGIIPVFISMTSYQPAAVRNKTNLTANLSVAIILLTSLSAEVRATSSRRVSPANINFAPTNP